MSRGTSQKVKTQRGSSSLALGTKRREGRSSGVGLTGRALGDRGRLAGGIGTFERPLGLHVTGGGAALSDVSSEGNSGELSCGGKTWSWNWFVGVWISGGGVTVEYVSGMSRSGRSSTSSSGWEHIVAMGELQSLDLFPIIPTSAAS